MYFHAQQAIYPQLHAAVQAHPLREDFFMHAFFDYMLMRFAAEIEWLQDFAQRLAVHCQAAGYQEHGS